MNKYLFEDQIRDDYHPFLNAGNTELKVLGQSSEKDAAKPKTQAEENASHLKMMAHHDQNQRSIRAKLIFNPSAGATRLSPIQLADVIHEMQFWKLVPEVYLVEPGCDLPGVVQTALDEGISLFVVCGGDGTISAIAGMLAGTQAILKGVMNF